MKTNVLHRAITKVLKDITTARFDYRIRDLGENCISISAARFADDNENEMSSIMSYAGTYITDDANSKNSFLIK